MKFTLSWLKDHLDTSASLEKILRALNDIGLEVEGVENPAEKLDGFRVAKVLTAAPHPQADKLQVLSVDVGDGPLQVVCGAPNARAGLVGVFGLPGATVPANGMVLRVAAIRGVESNGMMCSTRELELGEDHEGIIELPADAPIGTRFADYAQLDDPVIEVSVTPNRQDCMGVRGIARDLAAKGLGTLRPLDDIIGQLPAIDAQGAGPDVRTDDADGCPAFYARAVRGVHNGASPEWLQRRLKAIGQKPISALVDITNFVMIGLGRPLHVYDMARLDGGLVARKAKAGEQVLALNGKTYTLAEGMTVIADASAVHDIGGIMGGEHSGAQESTTDVLIECAYFTPESIARTGQALSLTSDARQRFERGVDPAFLDEGLDIATRLVLALCGGTPTEATRAGTPPAEPRVIEGYRPDMVDALAGMTVSAERQQAILAALGFTVEAGANWRITIPTWRRDIHGTADIVEEVVRIEGLDNVPSVPLPRTPGVARPTATPLQLIERRARRAAAARGLNEAINWSFISESEAAPFGGGDWTLANPISEDMKVMRPTLLAGLLSAARRNADRGASSIRLFEIGRRYFRADDGSSDEKLTLGILMAGEKSPRGWQGGKARPFDAFDIKAEVIALLAAAGAPAGRLQMMGEAGDAYHPGQSGTLRLGPKNVLAAYGVLHPRLARAFDLDGTVVAAEIQLDAIPVPKKTTFMRTAYAPPALQAVTRDFAFLVPVNLEADALVRAVRGADKNAIVDARLFDLFAGQGVPEGQKSLAVEVTLQPGEKSFTDEELKAIADRVVAAATKQGATLRG
ncbi:MULTISPECIES: phenylalanine--tRNA ligase subunit beta [unclassified Sphingobium]|uniref:phenylalanine--tRNA ligase subunit beta n=1 Tax=unclassified Sphingobium TaxID=2611147 RepID=UPI002225AA61|nr:MULTISPECIES: phenylalanine--tRNA ligase subunit beta [unclassified Sphingobium]MCW2380513.1 phenylalanyl-tRNA synthetase beta chain [Sphingobium sp. B2D3B]MCW2399380.1 phenylalanyl-tRNA synthetase beta chain [Sphingobium sp. B2D3C]